MKKILLSILGIVFLFNCINAQEVVWGKTQMSESKTFTPKILGSDDEGIITYDYIKQSYRINKYKNSDFSKIFSNNIKLGKVNKNTVTLEKLIHTNNNVICIISYNDKKTKTTKFAAKIINSETGETTEKNLELFDASFEKKGNMFFKTTFSPDKSKILIYHSALLKKQNKINNKIILFDSELNLILEKEEAVPITKEEKRTYYFNFIVANDGSLSFLKENSKTETTSIVTFDAKNDFEKWEEVIKIKTKNDITTYNIIYNIDKQNDLLIFGLYKPKGSKSVEGIFFINVDGKTKEIKHAKLSPFPKDFTSQFQTKRQKRKNKNPKIGLTAFNNAKLFLKPEGGVIYTGETEYQIYNSQRKSTTYYNLDIAVFNLSASGDIIWSKRIEKKQIYSSNSLTLSAYGLSLTLDQELFAKVTPKDFFSYLGGIDSKNLYIIYNENPKNYQRKKAGKKIAPLLNVKKAIPLICKIDLETGEKTEEPYLEIKNSNVLLRPKVAYQEDQNKNIYIFGQKGTDYRFGKIILEE